MTMSNLMSLPVDIPWRRLATSNDMIDRKYGDSHYPNKWFSSVSVFYHEPEEDEQTVEGRKITFIKVSCTVAGLQVPHAGGKDIAVNPDLLEHYDWAIQFLNRKKQKLARTYPCYGALLQLAVFPSDRDAALSDYPVVMDFEPKKRELYESAVSNKQFMSGSRSSLSIKKSTRVVDSTETSWNIGGSISASGDTFGGELGGGGGSKFGTSTETVDSITSDFSREKRENYAYTTNLTHMYHLLRSYHVGTNRAMFTLSPRPHISESKFVFTNAPQKLEGIQEFFLIVDRPASVAGLCVEATLETAHLLIGSVYKARIIHQSSEATADYTKKTAAALGLGAQDRNQKFEALINGGTYNKTKYPGWNSIAPDKRYNIVAKISTGMGINDLSKSEMDSGIPLATQLEWDNVEAVIKVTGINAPEALENLAVIYETAQQQEGTLAVLGRTVGSCTALSDSITIPDKPYLAYEETMRIPPHLLTSLEKATSGDAQQVKAGNMLTQVIGESLVESLSSPHRLPAHTVPVEQSAFFQDAVIDALELMPENDPYNAPIASLDGIDPAIRDKLVNAVGVSRRKDGLRLSLSDLALSLDLGDVEARELRQQLIGDGPQPSYDPTNATTLVPDLAGLTVVEAKQRLHESGLQPASDIISQQSIKPEGHIINHYPPLHAAVKRGSTVSLTISSGGVVIPDVLTLPAEEARTQLERQSLVVKERSTLVDTQQPASVLDISPPAGTLVPRQSEVILLTNRTG